MNKIKLLLSELLMLIALFSLRASETDGKIDVGDLTGVVNIILFGSATGV